MKNVFKYLFIAVLVLNCFVRTINCDSYTFDVTVHSGTHGTSNGTDESDFKDLAYDSRITASITDEIGKTWVVNAPGKDPITVSVKTGDDKYYIKGFHLAGVPDTDDDRNIGASFAVTEDMTLVPSYGALAANLVEYRVYYVDDAGNPLTDDSGNALVDDNGQNVPVYPAYDSYKGNPGSKPVVSYRPISGLYPQAYQITGTLPEWQEGAEDNVLEFTFVYYRLSPGEGGTEIIYDDTVVYEEGGAAGGAGGGGGGAAPAPVVPEEIIDIDEPEVPQTEPENNKPSDGSGNNEEIIEPEPVPTSSFWDTLFSNPWLLGGTIGGISLLAIFLFLLFGKRRNNAE